MGTTQPIRNRKELQKFSTYYQTVKPHPRNYALIILGLNTALRISDLLQLQWFDVYDFYTQRFREHLLILEQKTGKTGASSGMHRLFSVWNTIGISHVFLYN